MRIWFVHEGPRREHEELQRQHICPRRTRRAAENCNGDCNFLLSTKGRDEGPRRTATATATSFCPRRATKEHEELQRQHICPRRTRRAAENCNGDCNFLLSTEGREGPRRATKNCNGNTFVHGGHGGPRRTATATATSFCPRRATKEHEELQRQHICPRRGGRGELQRRLQLPFVHGGPRRATKNCNGNTFVHGGHGGPRRTATATATSFCPRRATKEHEELQRQHICPRRTRRAAENCNGDCNFLLSTEGREGPRRATKNCNGHNFLSTEDTGRGELQRRLQLPFVDHRTSSSTNTRNQAEKTATALCPQACNCFVTL